MAEAPICFSTAKKEVFIYPAENRESPAVYLNTFSGYGSDVFAELKKLGTPDHTLIVIGNLDWDADMSPWAIPPLYKNDSPCSGKADEYLSLLLEKIIPEAEIRADIKPQFRAIAGYSLAGLFAIYSLYRTDTFIRAASVSGSLWFPDFTDFAKRESMQRIQEKIYLSLGDRECKTKNQILKTVQDKTEELYEYYKTLGINTVFHLNEGNHFTQAAWRTACGIKWILD